MPVDYNARKAYTINPDGSLTVRQDCGTNPDGSAALRQWDVPAEQIKPHVDGMARAGGTFADMSAGDKSAALDAFNQRRAQAEQDAKNR